MRTQMCTEQAGNVNRRCSLCLVRAIADFIFKKILLTVEQTTLNSVGEE